MTVIQESIEGYEGTGFDLSRQRAILDELDRLSKVGPEFTKEQVLQWEAELLAERKEKE